jgi:hypothetical protein
MNLNQSINSRGKKEKISSSKVLIVIFTLLLIMLPGIFSLLKAQSGYNQQRIGISHTYPVDFHDWANTFLSGNGKMGIMVFGNPLNDIIIYNDRGFNLAKKRDRSFVQMDTATLTAIRNDCATGNFEAADKLAAESPEWKDGGEGNRHPGFAMSIDIPSDGPVTHYSRTCNYRTGEITVQWTDNRGDWERKAFVSRKDNVIVQYLKASTGGKLTCSIRLYTDPAMNFPAGMVFTNQTDTGYLNMRVNYPSGTNGASYEGVVRIVTYGGTKEVKDSVLAISGADSVILLTRTAKYYQDGENQWNKKILQTQLAVIPADYTFLLKGQINTHQSIYDRVKIDLGAETAERVLSNEELLAKQKELQIPVKALWERIFDAGRYYFLSSGNEETPPDLLGIWTGDCNAGWGGYYHLDANLNLQVGGGNVGDMPEVMEGYFKLNESWKSDFQLNAKKLLGCRGLLACGNTPGTGSGLMASINTYYPYQYATGEEGWLLYPFWEHYQVTGDTVFLRGRLYPLLKEMGYFYEDFLKVKDSHGDYIFAGSVSPENQPSNRHVSLLNNSDFDIAGARFVLTALVQTCQILHFGQGAGHEMEKWEDLLHKIPPYLVNQDGAMQEWSWPGLQDHYNHRHSSQLLMVWPYREITLEKDAVLFQAAVTTLAKKDAYNYENAGHGLLHSALIAANLKNAVSVSNKLLRLTREGFYYNSLSSSHYVNHGVFCMDVCNTVPAIMMEMLVGSAPGILELLPALPAVLDHGSISGVKGRNRMTIQNLSWDSGKKTVNCVLRSDIDQKITLIERKGINAIHTRAVVNPSPLGNIARIINLRAGEITHISMQLNSF